MNVKLPVGLTDHPRLRGEHPSLSKDDMLTMGSPPPARGAPGSRDLIDTEQRITPACAGSTPFLNHSTDLP